MCDEKMCDLLDFNIVITTYVKLFTFVITRNFLNTYKLTRNYESSYYELS
jgi:hypothetical protein